MSSSQAFFTPVKQDNKHRIMHYARQGSLPDVIKVLSKASHFEQKGLLNVAAESFARYGHEQHAKAMQQRGADPIYVALGFFERGKEVIFKSYMIELSQQQQLDAYDVIVFECASKGLFDKVNKLLAINGVDVTKAILGFVHGGYEQAANALCANLQTMDAAHKKQLLQNMLYGYLSKSDKEAAERLLRHPPASLQQVVLDSSMIDMIKIDSEKSSFKKS